MKDERQAERPETGPMQFGDDWPGVFIRGDNALMGFVPVLRVASERLSAEGEIDVFALMRLQELLVLLQSCCVDSGVTPQRARLDD